MTRMSTAKVALLMATALAAGSAQSQTAPDIISAQIDAFRSADFEEAFTYASDNLQRIFGSPENFGRMVAGGYPMVLDPAELRFLDRGERAGREIQRVLILDQDGRSFVLEYEMIGAGADLRIAGVRVLPETGTGV